MFCFCFVFVCHWTRVRHEGCDGSTRCVVCILQTDPKAVKTYTFTEHASLVQIDTNQIRTHDSKRLRCQAYARRSAKTTHTYWGPNKRGGQNKRGVTKNEGFNASKTKKCIGRGLLKTPKLINVPPFYSGPQSK